MDPAPIITLSRWTHGVRADVEAAVFEQICCEQRGQAKEIAVVTTLQCSHLEEQGLPSVGDSRTYRLPWILHSVCSSGKL